MKRAKAPLFWKGRPGCKDSQTLLPMEKKEREGRQM